VNEEKILDIPRAFVSDQKYSWLIFELPFDMADPNDRYFISNIKLAIGAPDTRHKLIEVGKFSTTGIKFDSGSDKLKPESYGILKEIATVLKENPEVKIKIIGHTDSDGKPEMNLELSKKRAISVKNALVKEFGIDEKRMETDGKGQTEPVDSNDTPAGKANNRRVEFVKL
jgi:outer membrane protein OmpA-like peptidoglycan-associated protein